jgi:pyrophosphate--fructose-6-phosphate 1-phosphotransferase
MMDQRVSSLQRLRVGYEPKRCPILTAGLRSVSIEDGAASGAVGDAREIREQFPHTFGRPSLRLVAGDGPDSSSALRVGVVLSGGQAPGGHNVIAGLFDAVRQLHTDAVVFGFQGGPRGIFENLAHELQPDEIDAVRNTGGFDLIGSGRDKIETPAQLAACAATCRERGLDGLLVIGGDDSNTNAAVLAEYFAANDVATVVTGAPKTIDGDLKGNGIEISFGFDTATKVYSELIGNICRDARSARKYWHFIKLMGRSASHVTLECALQTRPNIALIGEEVARSAMTLEQVVTGVADAVRRRAEAGRGYGVVLVPEGLIEFVPEMRVLIDEVNRLLAEESVRFESLQPGTEQRQFVSRSLGGAGRRVFDRLPDGIQDQLLLDRDSHGNVQVSKIDTEALLVSLVDSALDGWKQAGGKFDHQNHFFGYEGRCSPPSNFDADYTYNLGLVAAALIAFGKTGYIAGLAATSGPASAWAAGGVPLTSMMQMESRKGTLRPVIAKALVDLEGAPFGAFASARDDWAIEDRYLYPGAIQYFGPSEVADRRTRTLELEQS